MKLFIYAAKLDGKPDSPYCLIYAESIDRAQEMIEDFFYRDDWRDYFKKYYRLYEWEPTERIFMINQEDVWRFNHEQGVGGIGFASIDEKRY